MKTTPQSSLAADYLDLGSMMQGLVEKKWLILGLTLMIFIFTMAYHFCKPKKYQALMLLQIHQNKHHSVSPFSPSDQTSALENLPEQSLAMQIALIRSKFI